jgi:hypothetical protein
MHPQLLTAANVVRIAWALTWASSCGLRVNRCSRGSVDGVAAGGHETSALLAAGVLATCSHPVPLFARTAGVVVIGRGVSGVGDD